MNRNNSTTKYAHGFTLIETLFAILIFSAALVSLLAIAGKGITATGQVKNETVAFYLAQEGLEVVRNVRDSNFVSGNPWDTGFASGPDCSTTNGTGCYLEFTGGVPKLAQISNQTDAEIFFNAGLYADQGQTSTGFSRTIEVTPVANGGTPDEYTVTSRVRWQSRGITRSVELTTLLKKWR